MEEFHLKSLLIHFELSYYQLGFSSWWKEISLIGGPFIKEQDEHNSLVLFLWQDPIGNEKKSTTASVLLNVNSLTDHHSWKPACLKREAGTDVWFALLDVDSTWRGSYSFIPIKAHQCPDVVRKSADDRENQRSWWKSVVNNQVHDALNPLPKHLSGWGMSSPLHLPKAPVEEGWQEWEGQKLETFPREKLHFFTWLSASLENQRECCLFSTAIGDAPLVLLLDGQKWGVDSGTLSVIKYLTDSQKIAPAHYLLIPALDGKTRWKELGCYHPFWLAVVNDLLPMVKAELVTSGRSICDHLVAGQSLGGLSALYAALHFPDYFSKVITLSGSFWWPEVNAMRNPDTFKQGLKIAPKNSLTEQIMTDKVSVLSLDVFQTVGIGEQNMCLHNDMLYQAIVQKGGNIHYEKMSGGHDWLSWRAGLINGLLVQLSPSL